MGKSDSETEPTTEARAEPLKCGSCNLSARFIPLYMFNEDGPRVGILLARRAAIMCANMSCKQMYYWEPASADGATDGGWIRTSVFADMEEMLGDPAKKTE